MPKDLLTDIDGDLQIKNGDFVINDATFQNQQLLLLSHEGEWKRFPAAGVGINDFLNDEDPGNMHRKIRLQFSKDGMKVKRIATIQGQLNVNAPYES